MFLLCENVASCPHCAWRHLHALRRRKNSFTTRQNGSAVFEAALERLRELKIEAPLVHLANSAAVVFRPRRGHDNALGRFCMAIINRIASAGA
jgi:hypothetical protein